MLTARAFENTCGECGRALRIVLLRTLKLIALSPAIVFANAGGPPGKGYAGLSQVVVPFAGALTRLGSCTEGMSVVDVDMQILEDAEENYRVRADMARDDWHYDYRHSSSQPKNKL